MSAKAVRGLERDPDRMPPRAYPAIILAALQEPAFAAARAEGEDLTAEAVLAAVAPLPHEGQP